VKKQDGQQLSENARSVLLKLVINLSVECFMALLLFQNFFFVVLQGS